MLAAEKAVAIGGRDFRVRELTCAEIRAWLMPAPKPADAAEQDLVGLLLFEDVTFDDIRLMSNATAADLDAMRPSEVRELAAAAKEINADFFGMRRRLLAFGAASTPQPLQSGQPSGAASSNGT